MAGSNPITYDEMKQLIYEQGQMLGGVIKSSGGSSFLGKLNPQGAIDGFIGVTTGVSSALSSTIKGNLDLTTALELSRDVISKFDNAGKLINGTFIKLLETGVQLNEGLGKTSETGLYFGNNLTQVSKSINETRMGFDQFLNFMIKNSSAIAGLGPTVDKAAINFSKVKSSKASILNQIALVLNLK